MDRAAMPYGNNTYGNNAPATAPFPRPDNSVVGQDGVQYR
jgi:hypothetical protein